jgi:hypothetical protein
MKFQINYADNYVEKKELLYIPNEYSFTSETSIIGIDFYIAINMLSLTVVDTKVVEVDGFCPYGAWIKMHFDVPKYQKGSLQVLDDLEPGFSYGLDENDWPVYFNPLTGWVCVGEPEANGEAVEFMHNGVAVVNQGQLVSLWLKPTFCQNEVEA